jgi:hypothetical protein
MEGATDMTSRPESAATFVALLVVVFTCSNTTAQVAKTDAVKQDNSAAQVPKTDAVKQDNSAAQVAKTDAVKQDNSAAKSDNPNANVKNAKAVETNQDNATANPTIVKVQDLRNPSNTPVEIGSVVEIEVQGLDKWLNEKKTNPSKLVLYLDGLPIAGLVLANHRTGWLSFRLQPTNESKSAWSQLLGRTSEHNREFQLSIGRPSETPIEGIAIDVQVFSWAWVSVYFAILAVLLAVFVWMAYKKDIIRDSAALPTATSQIGNRPYSLAKLQMAVWFFLVLAAFLFIWIMTGQFDSITPEVLGLMGIAAGTALGASVIDSNRNRSSANQLTELQPRCNSLWAEIGPLEQKVADLQAKVPAGTTADPHVLDALQAAKAELAGKKALWEQLDLKMKDAQSLMSRHTSNTFLNDLLSDANGYSFARFQVLVWTILLSFLFAYSVWSNLSMPTFGSTYSTSAAIGATGTAAEKADQAERPGRPPRLAGSSSIRESLRELGPGSVLHYSIIFISLLIKGFGISDSDRTQKSVRTTFDERPLTSDVRITSNVGFLPKTSSGFPPTPPNSSLEWFPK